MYIRTPSMELRRAVQQRAMADYAREHAAKLGTRPAIVTKRTAAGKARRERAAALGYKPKDRTAQMLGSILKRKPKKVTLPKFKCLEEPAF